MKTLMGKAQDLFGKLGDILQAELNIYAHLLQLVENERTILIAANIEDLTETNISKDTMIARIKDLEGDRLPITKALALELGILSENPRMSEIIEKLDPVRSEEMGLLQSNLVLHIERITELNRDNENLAESALQNIRGALGTIRDSFRGTPTYKKEGAINKGQVIAGKLVSREA